MGKPLPKKHLSTPSVQHLIVYLVGIVEHYWEMVLYNYKNSLLWVYNEKLRIMRIRFTRIYERFKTAKEQISKHVNKKILLQY